MIDVETYGAAVGAAKRYTDEHSGSDDAVKYTEQDLTTAQQAQARENIGAASTDSVPTTLAELSDDSTHRLVTDTEKTTWNNMIPLTAKGTSNGVAELDSNGKVPSSQLPSFVDDVIEGYYSTLDDRFYEESTFTTLIEPVAGKSWVDIPANKSYRWTGSVYVRVDEGVQIGETSDTAYAGNKGKANADAIAAIKDGVSIDSFSDVETALVGKVDAVQGKGLSTNDYTSAEKTKLAGLENYDDTGIQGDISAIEEVIPSTATSQNQLATSADIPTDAVKYTAQTLTDAQKTQARTNIGVVQPNWDQYNSSEKDYIKNKPPIRAVYPGTNGSFMGGTGMSNMNEATKQNSIAYGYGVSAKGNYSAAFGYFLQALHDYEIAYGKFNQSNDDTAFSIGDGTSNSDKHNLMELKTDGRMFLNGNAVKTEDEDNYLWLEQICAAYVNPTASSNTKAYNIGFGFKELFAASSTVTTISFSVNRAANSYNLYGAFKFGDFIGYREQSDSTIIYVKATSNSALTDGKIHVKNGAVMFNECKAITTLDLSLFDTSKTEDMTNMFTSCSALTALNLSAFNTSNVKTMFSMFSSDSALTTLDVSNFDTSKVQNMTNMFSNCSSLTTLDLSTFDMTNVTNYDNMFRNAGITTLKTPKINPHDDIPLPRTLYSQDGTAYTTLPVTTGTSIELRQSWT